MDLPMRIADGAAALALLLSAETDLDGDNWPFIGKDHGAIFGGVPNVEVIRHVALRDLAGFVRAFPDTAGETLFRHAQSLGIHGADADGWLVIPACYRTAYMIFRDTLLSADREAAEEAARIAAREAELRPQPPNYVRQDETIMAQHGHLMERMDDAPVMVNLGGPDVAVGSTVGAVLADGEEPVFLGEGGSAAPSGDPAGNDGPGAAPVDTGEGPPALPAAAGEASDGDDPPASERGPDPVLSDVEGVIDAELVSEAAMGEASAGSPLPADPEPGAPNHGLSGPADAADLPAEGPDAATASADAPAKADIADQLEAEAKALAPARDADKPAGTRRKR